MENMIENQAWWEATDSQTRAYLLDEYTRGIIEDQENYHSYLNLRHARLYSNRYYNSLRGVTYGIRRDDVGFRNPNSVSLKLNVIKSVVDAVTAKITKQPVRPRFLTSGGDLLQQSKAENLNRYTQGLFYETNFHAVSRVCFRDACIFGTGIPKTYIDKVPKKLKNEKQRFRVGSERVMPDEIVVDPADGYYKNPQAIQQVRWISKKALITIFPEHTATILNAKVDSEYQNYNQQYLQTVLVIEGWATPRGDRKGRHVICVDGQCLLDEDWPFEQFPFPVMRYREPLYGYFGTGIAENLTGIQLEINRLLLTVQKSMHLLSSPKVFYRDGTINPRLLNNAVATFMPYKGDTPPMVSAPNAAPVGALEQVGLYYNWAYREEGISELSAASTVPGKLSSGKAIVEYRDSETERFSQTVHAYEQMHLDAAEIMLDYVREIGPNYEVSAFERSRGMDVIKWEDVQIDKTGYVMQCFPTSALSTIPSGRIADIERLAQSNLIPPDMILPLLDFPDFDAKKTLMFASQRVINKNLDNILAGKPYDLPEPDDDIQYAYITATQYHALAREKDADEDVVAVLDQYKSDVAELIKDAQGQAQQQMAPEPTPEEAEAAAANTEAAAAGQPTDLPLEGVAQAV
jgi:hypothetical protein